MDAFAEQVSRLAAVPVHPDITLETAPAPGRLAPFAHAITAEIGEDPVLGSGRFVLLHDPARPDSWESDTRIVVYVEADVEAEMAEDHMLTDVGWMWLREALDDCAYTALGGTVTGVRSTSYEALAPRGHETTVQIRASWSPLRLTDVSDHFVAWLALMETCAGLAPYHPDVTRIGDST